MTSSFLTGVINGLILHYIITLVALNRQNPLSTWKWLAPFGSYARAGDYLEILADTEEGGDINGNEGAWDSCCGVKGFPTIDNNVPHSRNITLIATTGNGN
jgi:hypothetical protein